MVKRLSQALITRPATCKFDGTLGRGKVTTWRIIPFSKWFVKRGYKPFIHRQTLDRGLTNHAYEPLYCLVNMDPYNCLVFVPLT